MVFGKVIRGFSQHLRWRESHLVDSANPINPRFVNSPYFRKPCRQQFGPQPWTLDVGRGTFSPSIVRQPKETSNVQRPTSKRSEFSASGTLSQSVSRNPIFNAEARRERESSAEEWDQSPPAELSFRLSASAFFRLPAHPLTSPGAAQARSTGRARRDSPPTRDTSTSALGSRRCPHTSPPPPSPYSAGPPP